MRTYWYRRLVLEYDESGFTRAYDIPNNAVILEEKNAGGSAVVLMRYFRPVDE